MMLLLKHLQDFLFELAPAHLAEKWDNVGLQTGNLNTPIQAILVALDVTEATLKEAERLKANALITHHPLIFKPIQRIDDSTLSLRILRQAIEKKIQVLSFHTNLDSAQQGLNDLLAKQLSIKNLKPLISAAPPGPASLGLGRIGQIRKSSLSQLVETIGKQLQLKHLRWVGDPKQPIQTAAVMTGSGGSFFREAQALGADVLITGDVKYHDALDALDEGIALIDIGHFAGEIGMVALVAGQLRAWLKKKKSKIRVFETKVQKDLFEIWNQKNALI